MATQFPITETEIDIELLRRELDIVLVGTYAYQILEIRPGAYIELSTVAPAHYGHVHGLVDAAVLAHVRHKDPTTLRVTSDLKVDQDLNVTLDLEVDGSNTIFNTNTVTIEDNIITLNKNVTTIPRDGGIEIERGEDETDPDHHIVRGHAVLLFDESATAWKYCNGNGIYYPIRDITNLAPGSIPRNLIETGLGRRVLCNAADGSMAESAGLLYYESVQGAPPNMWMGLSVGAGNDIRLADDSRICRGDVSNHFIRWASAITNEECGGPASAGTLQICNGLTEFWSGAPDFNRANLLFEINNSYITSHRNFVLEHTSPVLKLRPEIPLSENCTIQSSYNNGGSGDIKHKIEFIHDNTLNIQSVYGSTNIKSELETCLYNNDVLKFKTDNNGFTTSYDSMIIAAETPKLILQPTTPATEYCEIKSNYVDHVGHEARHLIQFKPDDSLEIKSVYGYLNLNCADGKATTLQFNSIDKLAAGENLAVYTNMVFKKDTGFNPTTSPIILQFESDDELYIPSVQIRSAARIAGTKYYDFQLIKFNSVHDGGSLLIQTRAPEADINIHAVKPLAQYGLPTESGSVNVTSDNGNITLTAHDDHVGTTFGEIIATHKNGFFINDSGNNSTQFSVTEGLIEFNEHVDFNDHVDFTDSGNVTFTGQIVANNARSINAQSIVGTSTDFNDLQIYSGDFSPDFLSGPNLTWVFHDNMMAGGTNILRPANDRGAIGDYTYPLHNVHTSKIVGYSTGEFGVYHNNATGANPIEFFTNSNTSSKWTMHYDHVDTAQYFRPTSYIDSRFGSSSYPLWKMYSHNLTVMAPAKGAADTWRIEATDGGVLKFYRNDVVMGHLDEAGWTQGD